MSLKFLQRLWWLNVFLLGWFVALAFSVDMNGCLPFLGALSSLIVFGMSVICGMAIDVILLVRENSKRVIYALILLVYLALVAPLFAP
jgi:hypothetical protein